jgi:hypothetical protein
LGVMRLWNRVCWIEVDEGIRHVARMHAPYCWRHCRPRRLWQVSLAMSAGEEEMKGIEVVRIGECACRSYT